MKVLRQRPLSEASNLIGMANDIETLKTRKIDIVEGTTSTLSIDRGGTGATTVASARNALGLGNTDGALPIANGGTGATTIAGARNNFGLGNTTGALPIANGGTGATTVALARNALGLGNTSGAVPIANGGTGATTAANALTNLGAMPKAGGTFTGIAYANNNTSYTTSQLRNIYFTTSDLTAGSSTLASGSICFVYE